MKFSLGDCGQRSGMSPKGALSFAYWPPSWAATPLHIRDCRIHGPGSSHEGYSSSLKVLAYKLWTPATSTLQPSPEGPDNGAGAGGPGAGERGGVRRRVRRQLPRCRMPALTMTGSADIPRPPRASPPRLSQETGAAVVSDPPELDEATELRWPGTDKGHSGAAKARPHSRSLCLIGQFSV